MKKEKKNNTLSLKDKKVIIFAGTKSPQWSREANELSEILKKEGYSVIGIVPISGLKYPKIEYLK
jgi:predicted CoA-binding protein